MQQILRNARRRTFSPTLPDQLFHGVNADCEGISDRRGADHIVLLQVRSINIIEVSDASGKEESDKDCRSGASSFDGSGGVICSRSGCWLLNGSRGDRRFLLTGNSWVRSSSCVLFVVLKTWGGGRGNVGRGGSEAIAARKGMRCKVAKFDRSG